MSIHTLILWSYSNTHRSSAKQIDFYVGDKINMGSGESKYRVMIYSKQVKRYMVPRIAKSDLTYEGALELVDNWNAGMCEGRFQVYDIERKELVDSYEIDDASLRVERYYDLGPK